MAELIQWNGNECVDDVVGAALSVYQELGSGFEKNVYEECLALEFMQRQIPYKLHPELVIHYKGYPLQERYRPDMVIYEEIVVELMAMESICNPETAKLIKNLKSTRKAMGYLLNFGSRNGLDWKRVVK